MGWVIRFGTAAWAALGWQRSLLVVVVTYISTYWGRANDLASNYLPTQVYAILFGIPGWAIGITLASIMLAFIFAIRLMPRVKIIYDQNDPACVHQIGQEPRKIFRLKIVSLNTTPIICTGDLVEATKDGRPIGLVGPISLTFSPAEIGRDALIKSVRDKIPEFLDIGFVGGPGVFFPASEYIPASNQRAVRFADEHVFRNHGDYELLIIVSSNGAASASIKLILHLTNDWQTTTVTRCPSMLVKLFSCHTATPQPRT